MEKIILFIDFVLSNIVFTISPSFLHVFHSFLLPLGWAVAYFYFVSVLRAIFRLSTGFLINRHYSSL